MKKLITVLIVTGCLAVSNYAFGITQKSDGSSQTAGSIALEVAKKTEFHGVIKKLDNGTALYTETGIYPLLGGNFETIVGKKVLVVGKVVQENDVKKISVARVQFAKK